MFDTVSPCFLPPFPVGLQWSDHGLDIPKLRLEFLGSNVDRQLVVQFKHIVEGHRRFRLVIQRIPVMSRKQSESFKHWLRISDWYQNFLKSALEDCEEAESSLSSAIVACLRRAKFQANISSRFGPRIPYSSSSLVYSSFATPLLFAILPSRPFTSLLAKQSIPKCASCLQNTAHEISLKNYRTLAQCATLLIELDICSWYYIWVLVVLCLNELRNGVQGHCRHRMQWINTLAPCATLLIELDICSWY